MIDVSVLRPNFEKRGGIVDVIAQDFATRRVVMKAFTDEAGYLETLRTGEAVYFSTSRSKRWRKGEESGDTQKVREIHIDCDGDAVIYFIEQRGAGACHTKAVTCFYRDAISGKNVASAPEAGPTEMLAFMSAEVHKSLR